MELHLPRTTVGIVLIILSVASADQLFPKSNEEFCTGEDCADIARASSDPAVQKVNGEYDCLWVNPCISSSYLCYYNNYCCMHAFFLAS